MDRTDKMDSSYQKRINVREQGLTMVSAGTLAFARFHQHVYRLCKS